MDVVIAFIKTLGPGEWIAIVSACLATIIGLYQVSFAKKQVGQAEKQNGGGSSVPNSVGNVTTGNHSPVTIIQNSPIVDGVPPEIMAKVIVGLEKKHSKEREALQAEIEEWKNKFQEAAKRQDADTEAHELFTKGNFAAASERLNKIHQADDKRSAANHFLSGRIEELQFKPLTALPHYQMAYRLAPDDLSYAHALATLLLEQKEFSQALPVFEQALKLARAADDRSHVAVTLNNLANLYSDTNRLKEAEVAYQEALSLRHDLAKSNPSTYRPDVAMTLNNLANLYSDTNRLKEAEVAYQEALSLYRDLAKSNPSAYRPYVAGTLNNLANLYKATNRLKEAEEAYQEALALYRDLAESNPSAYRPDVAMTLNNLANLYKATNRLKEAEEAYQEALALRRDLAKDNPSAYRPDVAMTLNNLAVLYQDTNRLKEAEEAYQEALALYRDLAKSNPSAYRPDVALTLNNLAILYQDTNRLKEARKTIDEGLSLTRPLQQSHPSAWGDYFARSLWISSGIWEKEGDQAQACAEIKEALGVAVSSNLRKMIEVDRARLCAGKN
jgi:tetratricopeptide (TPR) repeat protein